MDQSRTFQWQSLVEAAGVGAWGRTFQVWGYGFSWGTCGGASGVSAIDGAYLEPSHAHANDRDARAK